MTGFRAKEVSVQAASASPLARLDPHHYLLAASSSRLAASVPGPPCTELHPAFAPSNGKNLPQASYSLASADDEPELIYVSVAGISNWPLQVENCTVLRSPDDYSYGFDVAAASAGAQEVLVTRSGTPGVAWTAAMLSAEGPQLVPSGFIVRLPVDPEAHNPVFVAAILNHPVWRSWVASLATGKSQRNLTQELLSFVPIPHLPLTAQDAIAKIYTEGVDSISAVLESKTRWSAVCDDILEGVLGLGAPPEQPAQWWGSVVGISGGVGNSPDARIDARHHSPWALAVEATVASDETLRLRSLVAGEEVLRGGQPVLVDDLEGVPDDAPRVVATGSIQDGVTPPDLLKYTTDAYHRRAAKVQLREGDIVVAMDGEGAIGKAAVWDLDYDAVVDSHVGILRLIDPSLAHAVATFLNSTHGWAQIDRRVTGATGQTQVARGDLLDVLLPVSVIQRQEELGRRYKESTQQYEGTKALVEGVMVATSVEVGRALLSVRGKPLGGATEAFRTLNESTTLRELLRQARSAV